MLEAIHSVDHVGREEWTAIDSDDSPTMTLGCGKLFASTSGISLKDYVGDMTTDGMHMRYSDGSGSLRGVSPDGARSDALTAPVKAEQAGQIVDGELAHLCEKKRTSTVNGKSSCERRPTLSGAFAGGGVGQTLLPGLQVEDALFD